MPRLFQEAAAAAEERTHRSPKCVPPITDKAVYAMGRQLALDTLSQTSVKWGSCDLSKPVGTHLQLCWPLGFLLCSVRRNGDEEVFWLAFGAFFSWLLDCFVVDIVVAAVFWGGLLVWFYSIVQFSSLILISVSQ